jgi:hypothetical protein
MTRVTSFAQVVVLSATPKAVSDLVSIIYFKACRPSLDFSCSHNSPADYNETYL